MKKRIALSIERAQFNKMKYVLAEKMYRSQQEFIRLAIDEKVQRELLSFQSTIKNLIKSYSSKTEAEIKEAMQKILKIDNVNQKTWFTLEQIEKINFLLDL